MLKRTIKNSILEYFLPVSTFPRTDYLSLGLAPKRWQGYLISISGRVINETPGGKFTNHRIVRHETCKQKTDQIQTFLFFLFIFFYVKVCSVVHSSYNK